ncbi:MAG: MFS transporter [Firmicutes bacterium]|jgi:MFS family permease|nr:MFS transporter [Bacillota bacterium]MDH7495983.1 MFS transporter [Bacillota bacterium]
MAIGRTLGFSGPAAEREGRALDGPRVVRRGSVPPALGRRARPVSLVRHNFIYTTLEGMATNMAFGLVNPFLGVYALALGASSFLVALLTSAPALANAIVFLPAASLVERCRARLPVVLVWAGLHRLLYVPLAFIPLLPAPPGVKAGALVAVVTLMSLPGAIAGVAWTAMMGDMFPENRRGEVFGLRNMYVGVTGVLGTLAAGYLLDMVTFPANYMILFLAAACFAAIGIGFMSRMREVVPPEKGAAGKGLGIVSRVKDLLCDEEYGQKFKFFSLSCFMLWFGFGFTAAMWPIYHVEVLSLSNATIGAFATLAGIATVVSSVYWGKVVSRHGNRVVLLICMTGLAVFPATYMLSRSVSYLYLMQAISGFCLGGLNLTVFNLALAYAKPGRSASAVAAFNMMINVASFVAPFLGDLFYRTFDVHSTFYAGTCVRLVSLLFLSRIMDLPIRVVPRVPRVRWASRGLAASSGRKGSES